jgi:low temperature requirement protein LtrA
MRVSTLELFFDLAFVFTITQVTHLVTDAHGVTDLLRASARDWDCKRIGSRTS